MADLETYLMLDDVDLSIEEPYAADARAIMGYVNGKYANWPAVVLKWGNSGKHLVSVDVQANPSAGAQCLDVEYGDAAIGQASKWVKETQAAGKALRDLRWYPKLYVQAGNMGSLLATLEAAGIKRDEVRICSAHYTDKPHVCNTDVCGYPMADATQWTKTYEGKSLDATLAYARFFDGPPAVPVVPPEPKPEPAGVKVPKVVGLLVSKAVADLEAAGFGVVAGVARPDWTVTKQSPTEGVVAPKGVRVVLAADAPKPPEPVKPPISPVEPPKPVVPVVVPPKPVEPPTVPVDPPKPAPKPALLVYVRDVLTKEAGQKIGLPEGTILFIPHTVTETAV